VIKVPIPFSFIRKQISRKAFANFYAHEIVPSGLPWGFFISPTGKQHATPGIELFR
jgi:hypothetical protein